MEQVWVFERLAVAVARIDFVDPAVAHEPDARERGVRVEIRPTSSATDGSIYASSTTTMQPAVCRIDFLESAPGSADRMHWHPDMTDGEPGDRTFDAEMPADPIGWLERFLTHGLADLLSGKDLEPHGSDLPAIAGSVDTIGRAVVDGLAWARAPWPDVTHDGRGLAAIS